MLAHYILKISRLTHVGIKPYRRDPLKYVLHYLREIFRHLVHIE
jgi:hypothetical protein